MTLVADGRLSLADPFAQFLGTQRQPDGSEYSCKATVLLLGAHAAGFPSLFEMFPVRGRQQPISTRAVIDRYGAQMYPPGEVYEYSNIGYAILGEIAEQVLGQPFGKIMHDRVLQPLGLNDSYFGSTPDPLDNSAVRYDEQNQKIPYYTTAAGSTATGLAALYKEGTGAVKR